MTMAEWVRGTLRAARRRGLVGDASQKLDVVRAAARHAFPTADVAQMLAEIDRGYLGGGSEAPLR
jgi:hypothetical protein